MSVCVRAKEVCVCVSVDKQRLCDQGASDMAAAEEACRVSGGVEMCALLLWRLNGATLDCSRSACGKQRRVISRYANLSLSSQVHLPCRVL